LKFVGKVLDVDEQRLDVMKVLDVRQLMMEMRVLDATLEVVEEVIDIARGIVDVHGQKLEVERDNTRRKDNIVWSRFTSRITLVDSDI
jgi:hypothetical protein